MQELQDERRVVELEELSLLILRSLLLPKDKIADKKYRQAAGATGALLKADNLSGLKEMMRNWPVWPFERIIQMHDSYKASGCRLLSQMKELGSKELLEVVTSVSETLAKQFRATKLKTRLEDPQIRSISELVRITKLNPRTIKKLLQQGDIKASSIGRKRGSRISYEISTEEAVRIRELYSSSIGLSEAAEKLSCHELHIKIFARANVLNPVIRFGKHAKTWRFNEEDLNLLMVSLQQVARKDSQEAKQEQLTPLGRLSVKNHHGWPVRPWIRFAERIALGEVPIFFCRSGDGLNSLAVRNSDLPRSWSKR